MGDVIAMVNSGLGKESMDVIRADLGAFFDAEVALNIVRAAEVSAQANSARTMGLGIAAASIAIIMVIGFLIARSITTPIVRIGKSMANMPGVALPDLVNVSRAVAGGDLTIKSKVMIERVDIDSKDEVGEMAESFNVMIDQMELMGRSTNEMVDNLSGLVGQVGNTAGGVAEASESLSSAAEEAGNATQGISSSSQELAKGVQTQTESVDQTNAAMEQLSTAIEQIAKGG
jgi:methyl-accepting chemotaxis protein